MLKRILGLIFGDFGLVVQAALTSVVSWFVFPTFLQVLNTNHIFTTFVSILVGILAVGFLASSILTSLTIFIRSIIKKRWVLLALSIIVMLSNIALLIYSFV